MSEEVRLMHNSELRLTGHRQICLYFSVLHTLIYKTELVIQVASQKKSEDALIAHVRPRRMIRFCNEK